MKPHMPDSARLSRAPLDRPPATGLQRCGHCHTVRPLVDFNVDRARPTGYACWCRPCASTYQRRWRAIRDGRVALLASEDQPG